MPKARKIRKRPNAPQYGRILTLLGMLGAVVASVALIVFLTAEIIDSINLAEQSFLIAAAGSLVFLLLFRVGSGK